MIKNIVLLCSVFLCVSLNAYTIKTSTPPNIIIIFCDDLGYGDLSCFGSVWNQTPELDKMAVEGVRFTDFYAGAPVCTPSRAGLMTGCYARRVDLDLDAKNQWVLFPKAHKGINPEETILPEMLKKAGYSTAIIGKWHLGDQPLFLPVNNGFDYWFGLPYSNDMGIRKETASLLPLMQNEKVIDEINQNSDNDMSKITKRYTDEAIKWIGENKEHPFFLYLAHTMPHYPVAAREQFYKQTINPKVKYGASIAEISWSTGKILEFLKEKGISENTLVIFTSDNGGAFRSGANNGILRGAKGQVYEGGIRVPCIAWWPGKILPGKSCNTPTSVLDIYPTVASLADLPLNDNVKRDGKDISDYLFHPQVKREDRPFYYWHVGYLLAVRYGDWKLNLLGSLTQTAQQNILKSTYGNTSFSDHVELYNLREDPGEKNDISAKHPDIVSEILQLAETQKNELGQWTEKGPGVRKTIFIEFPESIIK